MTIAEHTEISSEESVRNVRVRVRVGNMVLNLIFNMLLATRAVKQEKSPTFQLYI